MKKYFKIVITFFLLTLLYMVIDVGFNINQLKQTFNDKNRVTINLNQDKKAHDNYLYYLNDFSKKNDVIITRQGGAGDDFQIYSSNPQIKVASNPFPWSNDGKTTIFKIEQVRNIGYNGFYNFSKNDVQEAFCQGVKAQKLGNCAIDPSQNESTLSTMVTDHMNYLVIIVNIIIILFTIYTYLLLLKKREINIRKLSGESFKNIYCKMLDYKLLQYGLLNAGVMLILLLINSVLTNNIQSYTNIGSSYLIILIVIVILMLLFRFLVFYVFYQNAQYTNVKESYSKKEYRIFALIFNILKLSMVLVITFVISKQLVTLHDIKQSQKDLAIFRKHQNIYTFGVRYTGQLDEHNSANYDKKASAFYKDLARRGKLFLADINISTANKDFLPKCKYTYDFVCNGFTANENYLNKFTNLKITNHQVINIFMKRKGKINAKEIIKNASDNMDLDGRRRQYIVNYYDQDMELMTIDSNSYKVKNPVILVDNMTYANDVYGSQLTGDRIFFETDMKQPFNYLKADIQRHDLENEIYEVYTPFSQIKEEIARLNQEYEQSFVIIVLGIIGLMALIYNNLKLYFDRYQDEIFLNLIHGVPLRYLIKRIYLINILSAIITIGVSVFLDLNIMVSISVIVCELILTYLLAWLLKNKMIKGEIK